MKEINVKQVVQMDNLTQDKSWDRLMEILKDDINSNEEIMLDFKGMNVIDPWALESFAVLMAYQNVNMRFTSRDKDQLDTYKNKIKMLCIMNGYKDDRVETVYIEPIKVKTPEELKLERLASQLKEMFYIEEGTNTYAIDIYKKYTQICNYDTVDATLMVVRELNSETGVTDFIVKTSKIFMQTNVLEKFAEAIVALENDGITLKLDIDSEEMAKQLGLHIFAKYNSQLSTSSKINEFKKLRANTAGVLIKYKKSRALDEFGRCGNGTVVSSRIAIFCGFVRSDINILYSEKLTGRGVELERRRKVTFNENGVPVDGDGKVVEINNLGLRFKSFNDHKFKTKADIIANNDGELVDDNGNNIDELEYDDLVISVADIGLYDKFLGHKWHFLMPVQHDASETRHIITYFDEETDTPIRQDVTLPERIKIVLNDWDVPFDLISLTMAESDTKKRLGMTI